MALAMSGMTADASNW